MKPLRKEMVALRIVLVGLYILAVMSFVAPPVTAKPLGYWEKHTYTRTIAEGNGLLHQFQHQGAISASAHIVSSDGKVNLTYQWNQPWLFVSIVNTDTKAVTVTWEEDFWVV
jgi:hypothetical protein